MTSSTFTDRVASCTGHFRLAVLCRGVVIERVSEPNTVCTGSRSLLAGLLGGAGPAGVSVIGFGTSVVPPDFGNLALTAAYTRPLDGVTFGDGTANFAFSLPGGEANGLLIGEFGLLTPGGVLFARKTRTYAAIPKDLNLSLVGTWTITF